MACTFQVRFVGPSHLLFAAAQGAVRSARGRFDGSPSEGTFAVPTPVGEVTARYTVRDGVLSVEVLRKPFLVGCAKIEKTFRDWLGSDAGAKQIQILGGSGLYCLNPD